MSRNMSRQTVRYVGAGITALAGLALIIAAIVLMTRGDAAAPIRVVAPQPAQAPETTTVIKVQVSGEVIFPGVYQMDAEDRLIDAVVAAGGISHEADLSSINMSRRVQDEAHYHIPARGESKPPASTPSADTTSLDSGLIDLNWALVQELEILPGIGPSLAGAIVAYREENGPFTSIDEVEGVPGIGPKTLDAIRLLVTVSSRP